MIDANSWVLSCSEALGVSRLFSLAVSLTAGALPTICNSWSL